MTPNPEPTAAITGGEPGFDPPSREDGHVAEDHHELVGRWRDSLGDSALTAPKARRALATVLDVPEVDLSPLPDEAAIRAVQGLNRAMSGLLTSAAIDDLTGVLRRGPGLDAATRELSRARRQRVGLVAAMVDVDGLKAVNDRDGHAAGDDLLRRVAAILRTHLRPYDVVFRYGGDEFLCFLPSASLTDAEHRFAGLRQAVDTATRGRSISVGLAEITEGDSLESLMARADAALYRSRSSHTGA